MARGARPSTPLSSRLCYWPKRNRNCRIPAVTRPNSTATCARPCCAINKGNDDENKRPGPDAIEMPVGGEVRPLGPRRHFAAAGTDRLGPRLARALPDPHPGPRIKMMHKDFLKLDGAIGGGQVLRSALSLSMVSGRAFSIVNIRAQRSRPGLLRQHLTAVLAAAEVCGAQVEGAQLGSMNLSFRPGAIQAGDYSFSIGTAGSCTLVLQTLLPALLHAPDNSCLRISGGTHNPAAPPSDFLQQAWLPLL